MPEQNDVVRLAETGLKNEITAVEIYTRLAKKFQKTPLSEKLQGFAEAEKRHISFWWTFLKNRQVNPETIRISKFKVAVLSFFLGLVGIGLSLKVIETAERKAIRIFSTIVKTDLLSQTEKQQAAIFLAEELAHEESFLDYGTKFKVFVDKIAIILTRTSDGLVIVISTSIGLASVYTNSFLIGVSGLIVGLAATLGTLVSTYFFVSTETRMRKDILKRIKWSCECAPEVYQRRIEKYMRNKSYDEETAIRIAAAAKEKKMIERIVAEEEYGISEKTLSSPAKTAFLAGLFTIIGVSIPLIPFLVGYPVSSAIPLSIFVTIIMLAFIGLISAIAAELDTKRKILELTAAGLILSMLTYLVARFASYLTAILHV